MPTSTRTELRAPYVLALDVGSSGSRGGLFDATGTEVPGADAKIKHTFTTADDGTSVIDADQIVEEVEQIIDRVLGYLPDGAGVHGVAIDTFSSSLVGVDGGGQALTPCFTYADTRCADQVTALRAELDEREVQQRTGTRIHTSYNPARLRWLARHDPTTFAAAASWLTLGEYVYLRLSGTTAVGAAAAAWTGMLNRHTGTWDEDLLDVSGIRADQMSEVRDPDDPLPPSAGAAGRWPALAGAAWYPTIGDGLAANLGSGAVGPGVVGVSAATSGAMRAVVGPVADVPEGLWCYRFGAAENLLGGAVSDLGRLASWSMATFAIGSGGRSPSDPELNAVLDAPPQPATPLVLPFLSGERSTGWAASAQAHILGVTAASTGAQLYRAVMEAGALSLARIQSELIPAMGTPTRIIAGGGLTKGLTGWLQILADALAAPVVHATGKRATLRGTALLALRHVAPDVQPAPATTGQTFEPRPDRAEYYDQRRSRFAAAYDALIAGDV